MDFSTPLIFVVLFIVASFSLFLVYKYGIKEKSYEEALAEQRQQTNALLGVKPKPKEKKNKKAAKKSKEKTSPQENETDESEHVDSNKENSLPNKPHVEFKETPEEVPDKEDVKVSLVKEVTKPKKVKKVRPILVRKDKSPERVILDIVDTPIVNHFEENVPKDDFELMRANSRDDIFKTEIVKEKLTKEKKQNVESAPLIKNKKNSKQVTDAIKSNPKQSVPVLADEPEEAAEKPVETVSAIPQTNGLVIGNPGKEKKKKKSEFNTKQQLTAERDGLINSVRNAELSKTEVQLLIDLLLNKQLEAPAVIDEWTEGKADPVQRLKKQLSEKEKAFAEEQEALAGAQAKLREVRAEQLSEKSQFQQKIRGLEELVQNKQIELQASNNRFQVNSQKIQQLQAELNAEIMKTRKFMEDNAALQMQIQQYDVNLLQFQEAENIIVKLRSENEDLSAENQQLRMELQKIAGEKEHQHQHFMMQIANMETGFKESHQELEKKLELALRQENEWKIEKAGLNTALQQQFEENRNMEHTLNQLNEQLRSGNNENAESVKYIAQLKSELQKANDEIAYLHKTTEAKKNQEVEVLNLNNELSSKKNELSAKIVELEEVEKKYKDDLENSKKHCEKIQHELEEQKEKNNELREKNWKVMEALNAAESKTKAIAAKEVPEIDVKKLSNEIITREQNSQKLFIQRLFPDIDDLHAVTADDWQAECGKLIQSYINNLKNRQSQTQPPPSQNIEVVELQAQLQHYKSILDETEGTLNKLQTHIEREEIQWRNKLAAKDDEIEHLKKSRLTPNPVELPEIQGVQFAYKCIEKSLPMIIDELQTKVINLEQQLSKEISEKQRIQQNQRSSAYADSTATIEKLSEEVNRLREQLRVEQTKNGEVNVCLKAQNCNNSTNGSSLIEHCLSSSSSIASSLIEELNKKPKNKKRKKKDKGSAE
ncbi:SMC superfamily domain-containing protein aluminum tubes isoform X2 [Leptinotarsa decemlineata]|uniref:SMC superfamily domain-containing protein aluminum tubes isoform X2 n=1 Tax=Leptinotarsa decemlineata TaxID=7539 RepID=UPI003D30892B